ncbi:MAG: TRAP transporter small permease subunit [Hyphomicrobiales bacterium]|nr:TRAP transporter small permease subunit [Hyphomicrobiales bacterium]
MLNLFERAGLAATRALSAAGLVALLALAVMTLADGTLRWLANRPIEGVRDVGALVIAVVVSCCIPVGLMERSNITIRVLSTILGRRAASLLDALAAVAVAAILVLIAWQFTAYAGKLAHAGETTWILKIPTAPFWYGVAGLLWSAVLVQAIVVVLEIARFFGRVAERAPRIR